MSHVVKRAIRILCRDGIFGLLRRSTQYLRSYVLYKCFPASDAKNTNWHTYIKELDARAEILTCTPWKLGIESTSVCNLQCIMCPHVFRHPRCGRHFSMKSLQGLEPYIAAAGEFQLMGGGEPTISPAFWRLMEYIAQHHKDTPRISISSNGAALTRHYAEKMLASPLQEVSFSLDAASADTYRKIRNADFDKTIDNIAYLLRRRQEKGQTQPFIMVNMTLMQENIEEFNSFIDLAHTLKADAVQFWPLHDYDPVQTAHWTVERNGWNFVYREQMLGKNAEDAARANALIDAGIAHANQLGLPIIWPVGGRTRIVAQPEEDLKGAAVTDASTTPDAQCHQGRADLRECVAPWEWMAMNESGDVRPCCYITKALGNLREQSPEEIWNGPEYREMRRMLARGKLPGQCRNAACKYVRSSWVYA